VVHLHYLTDACDWYIVELDEDRRYAYGYVNLGDPQNAEWGDIDLSELRQLLVPRPEGDAVVVRRDLDWTPIPFAETIEDSR